MSMFSNHKTKRKVVSMDKTGIQLPVHAGLLRSVLGVADTFAELSYSFTSILSFVCVCVRV